MKLRFLLLKHRNRIRWGLVFLLVILLGLHALAQDAEKRYEELLSVVTYDRNGIPIRTEVNSKGHYALTGSALPTLLRTDLLAKEDAYFRYHPGVNPVSMVRAVYKKVTTGKGGGSSTITEQLAKNLLGTENNRTVRNKLRELFYVFGMELFMKKDTILTMYGNTVYLGNQVQGFETGSQAYFGKRMSELTPFETSSLLATLSYPASRNPWREENEAYARTLYATLHGTDYVHPFVRDTFSMNNPLSFELASLGISCEKTCTTTLDTELVSFARSVIARIVEKEYERGVRNGAVVVIDPKRNELLAIVGTPDPTKDSDGGKINMAVEPRPIGSTIKPFIYLTGFTKGLRPYTKVDDREYRYPIQTGYSLYPKNFDGKYHGEITLHYALSNSLNVPSVKVLEYVGLPHFYSFLTTKLGFIPLQPLESYQYGIALGGLEMDLLTLTHYFSLFPREGTLAPLTLVSTTGKTVTLPHAHIEKETRVAESNYTALVTKLLSDRLTGVEQFGLVSSLNLTLPAYAVKTGTSRDFHDSWVVGYTPDVVVGVWLGNSENTPLAQVSGQSGAGVVWHDVMEYLGDSPYFTGKGFEERSVTLLDIDGAREWGLTSDVVPDHQNLLTDNRLITSPHEGDVFGLGTESRIPLHARIPLVWFVNGKEIGRGEELTYTPLRSGTYEIEGRTLDDSNQREIISISVQNER